MTYAIHEFDKWPFQMSITKDGQEIIPVGRHAYSTSDSLSSVCKRPENITQYAALVTLVEKANRAAQLEYERDNYKDAAHDWHMDYLDAIAAVSELRGSLEQAQHDIAEYRAEVERLTRKAMTK